MTSLVTIDPRLLKDNDYVELLGRLNKIELTIQKRGPTSELLAGRLELLMGIGNRDEAIRLAKSILLSDAPASLMAEARGALKSMGVPRGEWDV